VAEEKCLARAMTLQKLPPDVMFDRIVSIDDEGRKNTESGQIIAELDNNTRFNGFLNVSL